MFRNVLGMSSSPTRFRDWAMPRPWNATGPTAPTCATRLQLTDVTDFMREVEFKVFSGPAQC